MKEAERESKISVKEVELLFTEIFNNARKYILIAYCYLDARWKSPVTSRQMEGGRWAV